MKTINPIEQEVNQIRLAIYEKIKDMTPAQVTEYYRKSGEATAKKYGFKILEGTPFLGAELPQNEYPFLQPGYRRLIDQRIDETKNNTAITYNSATILNSSNAIPEAMNIFEPPRTGGFAQQK